MKEISDQAVVTRFAIVKGRVAIGNGIITIFSANIFAMEIAMKKNVKRKIDEKKNGSG